MHEYGINIRFLGQLASEFKLSYNKKVFQIQMVSRILKRIFFTTIEECKESFKDLLTQFLNFIFIMSKEG